MKNMQKNIIFGLAVHCFIPNLDLMNENTLNLIQEINSDIVEIPKLK